MNFLKNLTKVVLILIALAFTIIIGKFVPENQFLPYRLELDSVWAKNAASQEYMVDLNEDSLPELIRHLKINKAGHCLELWNGKHCKMLNIFEKNEFVISQSMKFADIYNDRYKEIIFITAKEKCAYLNIIDYNYAGKGALKSIKRIKVDSINYYNEKPDAISSKLVINKNDIWFNIQAAYSIQPRNIYKFNLKTSKLLKTGKTSIVTKAFELESLDNQDFLLVKNVIAVGNTVSPEESEMLKNSKDPDSIGFYQQTKDRVYQYGDFSSYILLYNDSLDFAFKPFEFNGWTNYTKSEFVYIDKIPHIVSITNTLHGDTSNRMITMCSLKGEMIKKIPMPGDFTDVFTADDKIVFAGKNTINLYSNKLELVKILPEITHSIGFVDINKDIEKEFITYNKSELNIFSNNFQKIASYKIEQEFAPYPEDNEIKLLQIGKKNCLIYNSRLFYYLFSYSQNRFAFLKYPFYGVLFLFWFGLLFLLMHFNSRRLKKEKQLLETIVSERTTELKIKNTELAIKNEEIQLQAQEISKQYERLEKLDHFKESLTHSLVHDLKNPLSQILHSSNNQTMIYPARKMLRLITNMLDVEKYENTEFILNKEQYSLQIIMEEAKSGHEISLSEKNLTLDFYFTDFLVIVDKDLIMRVMDNLFANAIRFSPQNRSIEIFSEQKENNMISITIKNYGDPIPEVALPYIFDKYRHFGKTNNSSSHSTGLGLAFCKMAVEAHGGMIAAYNEDNAVLFTFTLMGTLNQDQIQLVANEDTKIFLTENEKVLLKPFFNALSIIDVHQISDILQVLAKIPDESENIKAIKQKICDTAFAANKEYYMQLICL